VINRIAGTRSASIVWTTRALKATAAELALSDVVGLGGAVDVELEDPVDDDDGTMGVETNPLVEAGGAEEAGEEGAGAPEDDAVDDESLKSGGGTAWDGLVSAPRPQAMAVPSGCVAFAAGVLFPSASAIVKRPVQVLFTASAAMNW